MTTPLTAWYDDVLPDLTGLTPGNAALKYIRDALIDFCQRSQVYVIDHPLLDVTANQPLYQFSPGTGLQVIAPKKVMVNGFSINPATDDDLDAQYGDMWRNGQLAAGDAAFYRCPDDATLQIVPTPQVSIAQALYMRVTVKPTGAAVAVDDRLYNNTMYRDAVAAGAKWKAMLSPKKPWSSNEGAIYWRDEFYRLVGVADIRASKGFTRKPLRTINVDGVTDGVARALPPVPLQP